MTRRTRKETREAERLAETAVKVLFVGAAFTLLPLFLGNSVFGKALSALTPLGLLLLVAGGALTLLTRRASGPSSGSPEPPVRPGPKAWTPKPYSPPPVDRTVVEMERSAAESMPTRRAQADPPTSWSAEVLDVIEWRRFEALVEDLFRQGGFETKSQSHGPDDGVDVWLYSRNDPGAPVSVVQCKHWRGRRVGVDKVRELRGVMASKDVRRGQFVTTSTFTEDAITFGRENSINLLDRASLLALIARRSTAQQQALLRVALEGDYWRPTCVNCGIKMRERPPSKGHSAFWGCLNYPRCKTTMQMRRA